jgi:DNA-binding response OmpR family regulator
MSTQVAGRRTDAQGVADVNVKIVEDNEMIMRLVKLMLDEPGVVVASGGADAGVLMDVIAWENVDVAIVDLFLPGTGGSELLDWLAEEAPHVRRIAMSGSGRSVEQANADVRLLKPFKIEDLLAALRP